MIKGPTAVARKRYQPTTKALIKAAFKGACVGALIAFIGFRLWSAIG